MSGYNPVYPPDEWGEFDPLPIDDRPAGEDLDTSRRHEAAHAIAANDVGWEVTSIVVHAAGGGATRFRRPRLTNDDATAAADDFLVSAVGAETTRHWRGSFDDWIPGGAGDEEFIGELADRLARLRGTNRWAVLTAERRRARLWVYAHVDEISALAGTLARHGDRVEGDDVGHALQAAFAGREWIGPPVPAQAAAAPRLGVSIDWQDIVGAIDWQAEMADHAAIRATLGATIPRPRW